MYLVFYIVRTLQSVTSYFQGLMYIANQLTNYFYSLERQKLHKVCCECCAFLTNHVYGVIRYKTFSTHTIHSRNCVDHYPSFLQLVTFRSVQLNFPVLFKEFSDFVTRRHFGKLTNIRQNHYCIRNSPF